jgi:replicative DNA helicase
MNVPPNSDEAERAVIGSVMLDSRVLIDIMPIINYLDFYQAKHRLIFDAIEKLRKSESAIDIVTIASELGTENLKSIGGVIYLSTLLDGIAITEHVTDYAQVIKNLSLQRRMIIVGQSIADYGKRDVDLPEYFAYARESVSNCLAGAISHVSAMKICDTAETAASEALEESDPKDLVKTYIDSVDKKFAGLWPGLHVLASRPSMGKSTVAINIATNAALANKKVLIMSLEDTARFIQWRMIARLSNVDLEKIVRRKLSNDERQKMRSKVDILKCLPLWIDDSSGHNGEQLRMIALNHADKNELDLLIIDHLGCIREQGSSLFESTTKSVLAITHIAKELNKPVLLCCQLNRQLLSRESKVPNLGDLRQSGEIEQSANVVWFLHRPSYYDDTFNQNEAWIIVAKNRNGPTGTIKLWCDMPTMFIGDKEEEKY